MRESALHPCDKLQRAQTAFLGQGLLLVKCVAKALAACTSLSRPASHALESDYSLAHDTDHSDSGQLRSSAALNWCAMYRSAESAQFSISAIFFGGLACILRSSSPLHGSS